MSKNENIDKYLKYLIEDLEAVIKTKPDAAYFEVPLHLENNIEIAELALSPFRSIEKWTGIKENVFPCVLYVSMEMCDKVNKAILNIYTWLNLEIVDLPKNLPADVLYDVLVLSWDEQVQYLPSTGMDVELCSGDSEDCLYGIHCKFCNSNFIED